MAQATSFDVDAYLSAKPLMTEPHLVAGNGASGFQRSKAVLTLHTMYGPLAFSSAGGGRYESESLPESAQVFLDAPYLIGQWSSEEITTLEAAGLLGNDVEPAGFYHTEDHDHQDRPDYYEAADAFATIRKQLFGLPVGAPLPDGLAAVVDDFTNRGWNMPVRTVQEANGTISLRTWDDA